MTNRPTNAYTQLPPLLLSGLDSLYVCYYLDLETSDLDFADLDFRKTMLADRQHEYGEVTLGSERFLLKPHGAKPYRYVVANEAFEVSFAERLKPSTMVQFRSRALWHDGADALHRRVLAWAESIGAQLLKPESVNRADWAFDFHLPVIDFTEEHFASRARKDNKWRQSGKVQTFQLGTGDTVIRVYDKVAEIEQASDKAWFHDLWEQSAEVWRIEFQVRRERLRAAGIDAYSDLADHAGDLLRELAYRHTTLRQPNGDTNRARWPLHPLWQALQAAIDEMPELGLVRAYREKNPLAYRQSKLTRAVYGYMKGLGALLRLSQADSSQPIELEEVLEALPGLLQDHHAQSIWADDIDWRIRKYELGQW